MHSLFEEMQKRDQLTFEKLGHRNTTIGNVQVVRDKQHGGLHFVKGKMVEGEASHLPTKLRFLLRDKPNCFPLTHVQPSEASNGWCSAQVLEFRMPHFDQLVKDQKPENRKEGDIWGILIDITRALEEYERVNEYHGMVSPHAIIHTDQRYYLIDKIFFDSDHFTSAKFGLAGHLTAPEVYNQISLKFSTPIMQDPSKADIFSLALMLLGFVLPSCTLCPANLSRARQTLPSRRTRR